MADTFVTQDGIQWQTWYFPCSTQFSELDGGVRAETVLCDIVLSRCCVSFPRLEIDVLLLNEHMSKRWSSLPFHWLLWCL